MKRKYLIAAGITVTVTMLGFILWLVQPDIDVFNSITTLKCEVDPTKDIVLDFKGADVNVNEWGKDYVQITYDNIFGGKKKLDVNVDGNTLTLVSEMDFSGYKHMDIRVPKAAISINADIVDAKSGTFRKVNANNARFRYCSMVNGFSTEGGVIEVRECKLKGSSIIKNEEVSLRECDVNNVILSSDNPGKSIKAGLRDLSGISVKLDAKLCNSLSVELRDSDFDKFVVDSEKGEGNITILRGNIRNIENNSKIKILNKKSILR